MTPARTPSPTVCMHACAGRRVRRFRRSRTSLASSLRATATSSSTRTWTATRSATSSTFGRRAGSFMATKGVPLVALLHDEFAAA
eukprot:2295900-Pleurochrysis_carterae.AAC.1